MNKCKKVYLLFNENYQFLTKHFNPLIQFSSYMIIKAPLSTLDSPSQYANGAINCIHYSTYQNGYKSNIYYSIFFEYVNGSVCVY